MQGTCFVAKDNLLLASFHCLLHFRHMFSFGLGGTKDQECASQQSPQNLALGEAKPKVTKPEWAQWQTQTCNLPSLAVIRFLQKDA